MSDHWEFFPCQMGEHKASVFYNHSIRDRINELDLSVCARISVPLRDPRDDGLPCDDEIESLSGFEDSFVDEIERMGGVYVGRISLNGARHFYAYMDASPAQIDALAAKLTVITGYHAKPTLSEEFDKSTYWHTLYPTKEDWQLMRDLKVIEQLQEEGDRLEAARRIDHLAYFDDVRGADQFKVWLESEGFDVDWASKPDDDEDLLGISFSHACRPVLGDVTQHTYKLFSKAEELGGRYNGWGTTVEGPAN